MSEKDFMKSLKNFHGPEKFEELKKVKLFNKKVDLYNFYELAKRKGGSTDAVIITQWRDICIELGLIDKGEDITFEEAYKASQFFCYCFINFTYPSSGRGGKKRCPRKTRTKIAPNYYRLHHGSKALSSFHYRLLSEASGKFLAKYGLMDYEPRGTERYELSEESNEYDNLIWIARKVMNAPKCKFFNNKCSEDCTMFDNQWILPPYDASVPLTYKVQSKVACAAKLAAENTELDNEYSDESMSRSSDSEYDLVMRECVLSDTELAEEYRDNTHTRANRASGEVEPGEYGNGIKETRTQNEHTKSNRSRSAKASADRSKYGEKNGVRNQAGTKTTIATKRRSRSNKDLVRNIIHEVGKYLMSGYEIETCLTIILKSLTVVKLPKIPGLCRHMAHINMQFNKELIKSTDFEVQKEILFVLDLLCNILSLVIRDSFVEFVKHGCNNTYNQLMLCMESLQVTSCVLFLKINEAFQNNKFKHNDFTLDPNTQNMGREDGVEQGKKAVNGKGMAKNNKSRESKVTNGDFHGEVNTRESQLYENEFGSPKHTVDLREKNGSDIYNIDCRHRIHEYIRNNRNTSDNTSVNGNMKNSIYRSKHGLDGVYEYEEDDDEVEVEDKSESINHMEILSNIFMLIKFLSVISTELWQYDMICGLIDPFLKTAFKEIEDKKTPEYWLWDDFQEALCTLFTSCYYLSEKIKGKMKMSTVINLYMISASLLAERSVSKILFRKIVQMILSFHANFDFQMYKSMNRAIKGICEILVQMVTSSIGKKVERSTECKSARKESVKWYTQKSVDHIDPSTNRRADKTAYMDKLFLNADNPVANPWSAVPKDYPAVKKEPSEHSESSISDFESIIDYVKLGVEADKVGHRRSGSRKSRGSKGGSLRTQRASEVEAERERMKDAEKEDCADRTLEDLFGRESVPQTTKPSLEESVSFLQDYYRSVLGIGARGCDAGHAARVGAAPQTDEDAESATRLDSSRSTRKSGCSTSDERDDNDCSERRFRRDPGDGQRVKQEAPLIDDEVYEALSKFENTREIVCLCIAKMSEYSVGLEVVKRNYNGILECAYNDRSARSLWPVIHRIQSDQSLEARARVSDYELVSIKEVK
ncbi:membrance occupation and recognition nexus protein 1 [Theileria orientalis strain Shintoku]|uniref:Membrance occupation and recognition nexus protein 1 n=1 Tax=Theileria orientalis strain Shintoku TaxID=869250 RepID=J7MBZ0_THEOR|nr:membrance occupation and recognition nexus protein 1 [Theileria orientalis strain Shintoku]BAM38677.1 membrance occupation and recognition nexus protein 1 [Theileria orientalis strain Shintoku]|eukprot:XP_009688978.1 membrance occupation and recognition nexus protein 1 [Theileria orientalis strain Shintoku]